MAPQTASSSLSSRIKLSRLSTTINHIILPPKLPQAQDVDCEGVENDMVCIVQHAARTLQPSLHPEASQAWRPVLEMVSDLADMRQGPGLRDDRLHSKISTLKPGSILALHLVAQNAGLFMIYDHSQRISFECFEVSATSERVTTTQGRLLRTFPGRAVSCSAELLSNDLFVTQLVAILQKLNLETVGTATASTTKAGSIVPEERETTDPCLVRDLLMTMLSASGKIEEAIKIHKCTRDDVLWRDAKLPWRRSPFWLVLRVAIQRALLTSMNRKSSSMLERKYWR